ncbi:hypothetical protein AXA44_11820 [Rhodococcus sp. SC4]|nr:hypothetical protein AXA44_11820 [Rhodococcus sp. SC4]
MAAAEPLPHSRCRFRSGVGHKFIDAHDVSVGLEQRSSGRVVTTGRADDTARPVRRKDAALLVIRRGNRYSSGRLR